MIKVFSISPGPVLVFSIPTYWRGGVRERILMLISIMSIVPLHKMYFTSLHSIVLNFKIVRSRIHTLYMSDEQ